jgi:hypothetical protein
MTKVTPVIASEFILGHVLEILRMQNLRDIRAMARLASTHGGGLYSGGYEVFCHKSIPLHSGKKKYLIKEYTLNSCKVLVESGLTGKISFEHWEPRPRYFESEEFQQETFPMGHYIAPRNKNWPCFDSYGRNTCVMEIDQGGTITYTGLVGFQMTIDHRHAVMELGDLPAAEFARFLRKAGKGAKPWFIFVVPDFKSRNGKFTPYVPNVAQYLRLARQARIFVMELDLEEEELPGFKVSTDAPDGDMNTDELRRERDQDDYY